MFSSHEIIDGDFDPDFDPDPDMERDPGTRLRHARFPVHSGIGLPLQGVFIWRCLSQGVSLGYSSLHSQGSPEALSMGIRGPRNGVQFE